MIRMVKPIHRWFYIQNKQKVNFSERPSLQMYKDTCKHVLCIHSAGIDLLKFNNGKSNPILIAGALLVSTSQ